MMPFTPSEKIVFHNLAHEVALQFDQRTDEYWQDTYKQIVSIVARNGATGCAEFSAPQYVEQWHNSNREMINLAAQGLKAKYRITQEGPQCQPSSSSPDYSLDETLRTLMALAQSGTRFHSSRFVTISGEVTEVMARTLLDLTGNVGGVQLILTVTNTRSDQPVT